MYESPQSYESFRSLESCYYNPVESKCYFMIQEVPMIDRTFNMYLMYDSTECWTCRGVVAENDETIQSAAEGLGGSGFINYFGLQVGSLTVLN